MQQWRDEVSLETEIRLKSKDGTHNTSVRSKVGVIWTEPMCVTTTDYPLGKLTLMLFTQCIVV